MIGPTLIFEQWHWRVYLVGFFFLFFSLPFLSYGLLQDCFFVSSVFPLFLVLSCPRPSFEWVPLSPSLSFTSDYHHPLVSPIQALSEPDFPTESSPLPAVSGWGLEDWDTPHIISTLNDACLMSDSLLLHFSSFHLVYIILIMAMMLIQLSCLVCLLS